QIAQNWFKAQMNLLPPPATFTADGVLGISWFHVITMGLLAIFSSGMLAVYMARMRRANALVDRLTKAPALAATPQAASPAVQPPVGSSDGPAVKPSVARSDSREGTAVSTMRAAGGSTTPGQLWKGKLKVCAIFRETPSVKTFRLRDPEGGSIPFTFLPGQFLTYSAQIDGKAVRRSYTIA
ncbi:hypothetical protein KXV85_004419, partial [Aspergillus fumigatus]